MKKVRKAIFPVAGLGTRFLPATKAMPKELLTIVDKPLIQYAVEEAIAAGIETLVFITGRNKRAVEDHFDNNLELEAALRQKGKHKQANLVRHTIPERIECVFVRQPEPLGLGHAVLRGRGVIGDEPFAVLLADDFLISDGGGVTHDLVTAYNDTGVSQLSVMKVDDDQLSNYGVVETGNEDSKIIGIVEKPALKDAPSNLASIGRYVLTPDVFDKLSELDPGKGDEIQLSDAINKLAKESPLQMVELNGRRFDCGSVEGYVKANYFVSQSRALIGDECD